MKKCSKTGKLSSSLAGAALAAGFVLLMSMAASAEWFPALFMPGPEPEAVSGKMRWSLGDTVVREIDGETYGFRCIDENYSDGMEYHRQAALFLCDTVIPANHGSRYDFETPGDREHDYVYDPGPIVNFGDTNDYKYSAIRSWLKESEDGLEGAEPVNTGVFRAYTGSTPEAVYSGFCEGLTGHYIGSQKMTDRLFILSVDEAFKYRDWLWRFEGAEEDNPESQYGPFSKGYWLRTPAGTQEDQDTGLVYIVDLVNGNIRPAPVRPDRESAAEGSAAEDSADGESVSGINGVTGINHQVKQKDAKEDVEVQVTGTTGVRPAFVLPQN